MGDRVPVLKRARGEWTWLALLAAAIVGCGTPAASPAAAVGVVPSAPVVSIEGNPTDLPATLRGRVGLVSLWATWCVACLDEMDALGRLQAQAQARGDAVVVGVAVGEKREAVADFTRRRRLPYPVLVDESFGLADALGEPRIPTTLVVDRAGRVVFRGGALDKAGLAAFRSALEGR
ncbi:MAG TPA: TlpA disulfide reductase family protein [Polyangiaceae bacterium]